MHEATFELEALTPLFMRGADQRKAEFRSASLKGVMRWWFRALAGNYFGNDIDGLRKAECRVFGCAGRNDVRKSAVVVEVEPEGKPKKVFFRPGVFDRDSWINDLNYLFFSLKISLKKLKNPTFYPSGSRFRVTISSPDEDAFHAAIASLWTAVTLGGFGSRARRGAGNMRFLGSKPVSGLPVGPQTPGSIRDGIKRAVDLVGGTIRPKGGVTGNVGDVKYPVLSESSSVVAVWIGSNYPKEVLKTFQGRYQTFRRNSVSPRSAKVTLGLPMVKGNFGDWELGNAAKNARRASPLIISVIPSGSKYTLAVTKFRTRPYYHVQDAKSKWIETKINSLSDWGVLYQFDRSYHEEVVYGSLEVFQ